MWVITSYGGDLRRRVHLLRWKQTTRAPRFIKFDKMVLTQTGTATGATTGSLRDRVLDPYVRIDPYLPDGDIRMVRYSHLSEMVCQVTNGTHRSMRPPPFQRLCSLVNDLEQLHGTVCGTERESRERKRRNASATTTDNVVMYRLTQ